MNTLQQLYENGTIAFNEYYTQLEDQHFAGRASSIHLLRVAQGAFLRAEIDLETYATYFSRYEHRALHVAELSRDGVHPYPAPAWHLLESATGSIPRLFISEQTAQLPLDIGRGICTINDEGVNLTYQSIDTTSRISLCASIATILKQRPDIRRPHQDMWIQLPDTALRRTLDYITHHQQ